MGMSSDKFHTRFYAMQRPLRMLNTMISGKPIDLSRNVMVTKALQDKCEYIFFLDSDILVNPDTLMKLFTTNMPIVSAVYYSRSPPYEMVAQVGGRGLSHNWIGSPPSMLYINNYCRRRFLGCCPAAAVRER